MLGDGIEHLAIDRRGRIWVGYFDEGVFGNFGWQVPGPVGAAGLVCFSDTGEKLWECVDGIVDCYALNVSRSEAFAYYYTDFPIYRISEDLRVARWRTDLRGCTAFAISTSAVVLSGQYEDPPGAGYYGLLTGDAVSQVRRVSFVLPDHSLLPTHDLIGRGRHLYYFAKDAIYRATLD